MSEDTAASSPRNERMHTLWITAVSGLFATVVGGIVVVAVTDDHEDEARQESSSTARSGDGTTRSETPADESDMTDSVAPTTLVQLSSTPVREREGTVAGRPTPPSPTFTVTGSQCAESATTYVGALDDKYETLEFVASLDDESPTGSRVDVQVLGDGRLLAQQVVEARTSGAAVSADVADVAEVSIVMTPLTRTERCDIEQLQIHLAEGVAR